jgi:hypothetical protein
MKSVYIQNDAGVNPVSNSFLITGSMRKDCVSNFP